MIQIRGRRTFAVAIVFLALAGCSAGSSETGGTSAVAPAGGAPSSAYPTPPYGRVEVDYVDIGPDRDCGFKTPLERRPDLVGRTLAVASASERQVGREIRVIGSDGHCAGVSDDLRPDRVNVYLDDGVIKWAGMG